MDFFDFQSVDTVYRCTTSYLLAGPACLRCLVATIAIISLYRILEAKAQQFFLCSVNLHNVYMVYRTQKNVCSEREPDEEGSSSPLA
jgi:hypothetical protein